MAARRTGNTVSDSGAGGGLPLPEGRLIKVESLVRLPAAATPDQVEEWIEFSAFGAGSMRLDNPLSTHEPESFTDLVLTDTEKRGVTKHVPLGDGRVRVEHYVILTTARRRNPEKPEKPGLFTPRFSSFDLIVMSFVTSALSVGLLGTATVLAFAGIAIRTFVLGERGGT